MKTALATEELGLGLTVAPVGVAAPVTSLRGVPGVYGDDLAASGLRLVLKEFSKLSEAPRMKSAAGFPMIDLNLVPNVSEVLQHDSRTGLNAIKDRGRQNVVAIPSEALFTPSEASKMPFGRLRTFGLQVTSEAKYLFDNFLHMLITMKTIVGANGWSDNSQVYTDSLTIGNKFNIGQSNYSVKIESPFAIDKVGGSRRATHSILGILRKPERNLDSTINRSQVHDTLSPIQREGVQVITRGAKHRLGASCSQSLLLSGNRRLYRFGSFLSGLNMQVRYEIRQSILTITVRQAMKSIGVAVMLFPSNTADSIERLGELLHCFMQCISLFLRRLEQYTNRSIHNDIIPYTNQILQCKEVGQFLCQLKQAVPLP